MYVRQSVWGEVLRRAGLVGAVALGGCGVNLAPPDVDGPRSTSNLTSLGIAAGVGHFEATPNDLFASAEFVDLGETAQTIHGRIGAPQDIDVFDLGPVGPGDRVVVSMIADETLNGALGLFDASGASLLINDNRNSYLGRTEPFIDVVIRHESAACYVAVSATPGRESVGDYALDAGKSFQVDPPPPRPDVVLLDFDGASLVRIGLRPPVEVPVFDPANISPVFAGQRDAVIAAVVDRIRADYAPYDVTIVSTSEGGREGPGISRIFFGTYDPALLGLAEGIDEFNATSAQQAIIFTDTFRALTRLGPTVADISQALANVASHEIGHLLGLVHTADPTGIMDVTASLSELIRNQHFKRSPIYSAAFPIGSQDAVQYLLDTVGGDFELAYAESKNQRARVQPLTGFSQAGPARLRLRLSTCSLDRY